MKTQIRKVNGAPCIRHGGELYQFSQRRIRPDDDQDATLIVDHNEAVELEATYTEVQIVERNVVPSLEEAREDYDAARTLATHHGLDASGTHEDILERLETEISD